MVGATGGGGADYKFGGVHAREGREEGGGFGEGDGFGEPELEGLAGLVIS